MCWHINNITADSPRVKYLRLCRMGPLYFYSKFKKLISCYNIYKSNISCRPKIQNKSHFLDLTMTSEYLNSAHLHQFVLTYIFIFWTCFNQFTLHPFCHSVCNFTSAFVSISDIKNKINSRGITIAYKPPILKLICR